MTAVRLLGASVVLLAALVGPTQYVYSQDTQGPELLHVQGNVSMLAGAGGNIAVQVGKDGILLVDSGSAPMTDKVVQALRNVSKGQVTYIVNTNERADHVDDEGDLTL
jgi:glyoxylase-like metal-dependent hydrolase (beta-lactamase superfamily II)